VKAVAETLSVARSNLIERLKDRGRPRQRYCKAEDAALLPRVRRLVDERPSYGYRRLTALLNRELAREGWPRVNHKRVYRLMQVHGLLLARHPGHRPGRAHDGKVAVMASNLRWCSDGFEFTCWNGEIVRATFVMDAHDREIIAWKAVANAGIPGSDVRDMMLEAVEKRFGAIRAPHAVEWLSDNGSPYKAIETRRLAAQLNLVSCFTPVASPESNGMSEAFVKTIKRDHVHTTPIPDAEAALDRIAGWFEDYNDNHPHSGLRMRSPREFRRAL
jgi:putative transposase